MSNRTLAVLIPLLVVALLAVSAPLALAAEGGKADSSTFFIVSVVTAGFALAIATSVASLAQSRAIMSALDAIGRQPSAAPRIQIAMIIGLALIESLAIYVLLIALILFFANPFIKYVVPGA
jgi:F-type H+-transporting ATPase subunit c